jgi:hypothetical protein
MFESVFAIEDPVPAGSLAASFGETAACATFCTSEAAAPLLIFPVTTAVATPGRVVPAVTAVFD